MSENLLSEFIFDSREHLSEAGTQLLDLEKNPGSLDSLNALLGTFHTIKGNSGFLDLKNLYQLFHHAESLLQTIREKHCDCPQPVIDLQLQVLDTVEAILNNLEGGGNDEADWLGALNQALSETEDKLESGADLGTGAAAPAAPATAAAAEPEPAAEQPQPLPAPVGLEETPAGWINMLTLADGSLARAGDGFPEEIEALFQTGQAGLVVDLRNLTSLTAPELTLLLTADRARPEKTAFLVDPAGQPDLQRLFQVLDPDGRLRFFPDQAPALACLKGA